jgi:hypothetical protein
VGQGEGGGGKERAEGVRRGERERGLVIWEQDRFGIGEVLRRKKRGRNHYGVGQLLFESQADRDRSGIRSEIVDCGRGPEEYMKDEIQPWEQSSRLQLSSPLVMTASKVETTHSQENLFEDLLSAFKI